MNKWEVVKVGDWWTVTRPFISTERMGTLCGKRTGGELYEDEAKVVVEMLNKVDEYDGGAEVMVFPRRGLTQG